MKRPFYIELVEHNFRLAVRLRYEQIQGGMSQQWLEKLAAEYASEMDFI